MARSRGAGEGARLPAPEAIELVRDSTELNDVLLPGTAAKLTSLTAAAPYVSQRDLPVGDTLALLNDLAMAGRFGTAAFALSSGTFRDLESTGNLRLLRNSALRASILAHHAAAEREMELADARRSAYAMYFSGLIPGEMFVEGATLDELRRYDLGRVLERSRSEGVRDMLNQEVNYAMFLRRQHRDQVARVNALLLDIRGALKEGR